MREASKAAANAVASIGNDRSVREIPSCLSYRPAIEIETVTTEREENLAKVYTKTLDLGKNTTIQIMSRSSFNDSTKQDTETSKLSRIKLLMKILKNV